MVDLDKKGKNSYSPGRIHSMCIPFENKIKILSDMSEMLFFHF